MKFPAFVAALLAALLFVAGAFATTSDPRLDAVASIFAGRPVVVLCYAKGEEGDPDTTYGAWGYVKFPLRTQRAEHLQGRLCVAALDINNTGIDARLRAEAVVTLVHESYHLLRWGGASSEAKVQCRAIRHFGVGARLLGATEATVAELRPTALADHYETVEIRNPWTGGRPYYDPACVVPTLFDP